MFCQVKGEGGVGRRGGNEHVCVVLLVERDVKGLSSHVCEGGEGGEGC
jgi:hypothetical protein